MNINLKELLSCATCSSWSCLSTRMEYLNSRGPFPPSAVLWFCDNITSSYLYPRKLWKWISILTIPCTNLDKSQYFSNLFLCMQNEPSCTCFLPRDTSIHIFLKNIYIWTTFYVNIITALTYSIFIVCQAFIYQVLFNVPFNGTLTKMCQLFRC